MLKRGVFSKRRGKKQGKERLTVQVHPLFLLFGVFFLLRGEIFLFLSCTVVAIIHEFGHALYAARIGRRLDKVVLLPCGAVVTGDIEGISLADEIRLALAGPAVNLVCALFFVALWWLFPDLYPYTDVAAYTSAGLAAINLLPAWPLDGGRVLYCALARKIGERHAHRATFVVSLIVAALFLSLFIYSFFVRLNFTLLFFALFILAGSFGGNKGQYRRLQFDRRADMARGLEVKKVAVGEDCTVGRILRQFERGKYLEITVYDENGDFSCELDESEFFEIFSRADLRQPLSAYLSLPENGFISEEKIRTEEFMGTQEKNSDTGE